MRRVAWYSCSIALQRKKENTDQTHCTESEEESEKEEHDEESDAIQIDDE